jgi:ABC-type sugar transport system ATPase subunit
VFRGIEALDTFNKVEGAIIMNGKSVELNKKENEFLQVQNDYIQARKKLDELNIVENWFLTNNQETPLAFIQQHNVAKETLSELETRLYSLMGYDLEDLHKIS